MLTGFVLPGGSATEQLEQAVLAEQAGWDGVFVPEVAYGVDAWSLLAAMAARTQRIRLGTLLTPLPWRRPAELPRGFLRLRVRGRWSRRGGAAALRADPDLGGRGVAAAEVDAAGAA